MDGPTASGKSAVGKLVAERLGYRFLDTGLMYRAVTWLALRQGTDLDNPDALGRMAEGASLTLEPLAEKPAVLGRVAIDGSDVTGELRRPEVGEAVSLVSRVPAVRAVLVAQQRALASRGDIVMAGRDIGTVVLPDASLKVYLDASVEERVRRRHAEFQRLGRSESVDEVRAELELRDRIDSGRDVSPLRPTSDALVIDTGGLSLKQVVERILEAA